MSAATPSKSGFDSDAFSAKANKIIAERNAASTDSLAGTIKIYRVVVGFLIASLLWKCKYFPLIHEIYSSHHLKTDFFPALLSNPNALAGLYATPVLLGLWAMMTRNKFLLRVQAITIMVCMFGLCIHQGSYNDVTFLTSFWVSVWCAWFTMRIEDAEEVLMAKAKTFGLLIASLIFLGGAAGKWTPEYWSGEVFYEIYFIDRDYWAFNFLRTQFEGEGLRNVATYYSRMVIIIETLCAFLWLLPVKAGSAIALVVLFGIALFSNVNLFSVVFCLFGLMLVGLHEPKK
ncbi:MAG: hypothetical protein AB8B55_09060 [Mariniblastus sp.]